MSSLFQMQKCMSLVGTSCKLDIFGIFMKYLGETLSQDTCSTFLEGNFENPDSPRQHPKIKLKAEQYCPEVKEMLKWLVGFTKSSGKKGNL